MIRSSGCQPWRQLDRPGPTGDYDGRAAVTPLTGTRPNYIEKWGFHQETPKFRTLDGLCPGRRGTMATTICYPDELRDSPDYFHDIRRPSITRRNAEA